MATFEQVISPFHNLNAFKIEWERDGRIHQSILLSALERAFATSTNGAGHLTLTNEELDQIIERAAASLKYEIKDLLAENFPDFLSAIGLQQPEITIPTDVLTETSTPENAPENLKTEHLQHIGLSFSSASLSTKVYLRKPQKLFSKSLVFEKYPELFVAFVKANILTRKAFEAALVSYLALTPNSAATAASRYLNLKDPGVYPLHTSLSKRFSQIPEFSLPESFEAEHTNDPKIKKEMQAVPLTTSEPVVSENKASLVTEPTRDEAVTASIDPEPLLIQKIQVAKKQICTTKPIIKRNEPNFFIKFYKGKSLDQAIWETDTALTLTLTNAGIESYDDLLERRKNGSRGLYITNNTLKKLRKRAISLGINGELQAGQFIALGPRNEEMKQEAIIPPPQPAIHVINRAFDVIVRPPAQSVPRSQQGISRLPDFSSTCLKDLTHAEVRALRHFMERVEGTSSVRESINRRTLEGKIDVRSLSALSIPLLLRRQNGQSPQLIENEALQLVDMGVLHRRPLSDFALSQEFIKRFEEVVDWHNNLKNNVNRPEPPLFECGANRQGFTYS